jgi:hypothetical protein
MERVKQSLTALTGKLWYCGACPEEATLSEPRGRTGERVCREDDPSRHDVIAEFDRVTVKVSWDNGATSYYRLEGHSIDGSANWLIS